jgi:hypothetical protein
MMRDNLVTGFRKIDAVQIRRRCRRHFARRFKSAARLGIRR